MQALSGAHAQVIEERAHQLQRKSVPLHLRQHGTYATGQDPQRPWRDRHPGKGGAAEFQQQSTDSHLRALQDQQQQEVNYVAHAPCRLFAYIGSYEATIFL